MLCAGIAAAGGNCVDAAAWGVVAEIGSLKQMAGVSAVSANSPRFAVVAGRGAQRAGARVAAVSEFAVVGVDLRLPQHYRNRLEKFDLIRGFATQSTSKGTRTKFRFCERGGGAA